MRLFCLLLLFACSSLLSAQLAVSPTSVVYSINGDCDGNWNHQPPTLQATGGSGSYAWTALTAPPANLMLEPDGTFTGQIASSSGSPFTFDVEVTDSMSMQTAQATITMTVVTALPGCQPKPDRDDDDGCAQVAARGGWPAFALLLVIVAICRGVRRWQSRCTLRGA
ncbi:MAG: hypothetical protein IPK87_15215 [Planctomycetes bacterium]|nr:hypothetical protein [Planctomycetota bacterium]